MLNFGSSHFLYFTVIVENTLVVSKLHSGLVGAAVGELNWRVVPFFDVEGRGFSLLECSKSIFRFFPHSYTQGELLRGAFTIPVSSQVLLRLRGGSDNEVCKHHR